MTAATVTKKPVNLKNVVDKLGHVKAQLADLKEQEETLRDKIVEAGVTEAEGKLFRATVSEAERTNIDWKTVVGELRASLSEKDAKQLDRLIDLNTSVKLTTTVKVVSR